MIEQSLMYVLIGHVLWIGYLIAIAYFSLRKFFAVFVDSCYSNAAGYFDYF
jgi:hypothetical protein